MSPIVFAKKYRIAPLRNVKRFTDPVSQLYGAMMEAAGSYAVARIGLIEG